MSVQQTIVPGELTVTLRSELTLHITRGDWSPRIFKIAYYELVLSYSTLPVRFYKFETIRYVIKLKKYWLISGLCIIKNFAKKFFDITIECAFSF